MQTSTRSQMQFRQAGIGRRRATVQENQRKVGRSGQWEDLVATFALALKAIILFGRVYQAMVP